MKGVHLMAHSRGSALLLNALRELGIETIAAGVEPLKVLKIDNVVLMAPGNDLDVADQQMQIFTSNPDIFTSPSRKSDQWPGPSRERKCQQRGSKKPLGENACWCTDSRSSASPYRCLIHLQHPMRNTEQARWAGGKQYGRSFER